jgi:L-serine/L-threonine ammonia-lyase
MTPLHLRTPLIESRPLSLAAGRPVFLKMDALQPSGSFKIRGLGYVCQRAYARGERRLVAASGGNAGLAVAFAARTLGAEARIVVPERCSDAARRRIREEGAEVIVHGDVWDDAHAYALALCERDGGFYVHPFEGESTWEGHASLIAELADAGHRPGAVVLVGHSARS